MTEYDISKLNNLYNDAETCDKDIFAEMKSNLLMVSGDHWKKTSDRLYSRVQHAERPEQDKLRIVKNHTQRAADIIKNAILSQSPGVDIFPYNESELQDQKAAELSRSVWADGKERNRWCERVHDFIDNYIEIGEVAAKIYFDDNKGRLIGYEQAIDEFGQPAHDPMTGEPMANMERPKFEGAVVIEPILAFNLLRSPQAENFKDSPYVIYRRMADVEEIKKLVGDDEDLKSLVQESSESTYKVFDGNTGHYAESKNQIMIREYYFRPCLDFPRGYFYITADNYGILFEGEIPCGDNPECFPIVWEGYKKISTSARARSFIRNIRPAQLEINRCASSISTTQIHMGMDKVLIASGSKVSKGLQMPGMRFINYSGPPPQVISGRSGDQYFEYLSMQIKELYELANLSEEMQDKSGSDSELYTMLFKSMKHKKKFSLYAQKFENFLANICKCYIKLAQAYYSDDRVIRAIGKNEAINIPEFKQVKSWNFQIKVKPVSDDLENTLGRMLEIQNVLQYASDLPQDIKLKMLKYLPFLNREQMFDGMLLDHESATNMLLSLDRGEQFDPHKYDKTDAMIGKLVTRIRKPDFKYLSPEIQQNYYATLQYYEKSEAEQQEKALMADQGAIPIEGALVGVDYYITAENSRGGTKTQRARVPMQAIEWLIKKLETQALSQERLQGFDNQTVQNEILEQMNPNGMASNGMIDNSMLNNMAQQPFVPGSN